MSRRFFSPITQYARYVGISCLSFLLRRRLRTTLAKKAWETANMPILWVHHHHLMSEAFTTEEIYAAMIKRMKQRSLPPRLPLLLQDQRLVSDLKEPKIKIVA